MSIVVLKVRCRRLPRRTEEAWPHPVRKSTIRGPLHRRPDPGGGGLECLRHGELEQRESQRHCGQRPRGASADKPAPHSEHVRACVMSRSPADIHSRSLSYGAPTNSAVFPFTTTAQSPGSALRRRPRPARTPSGLRPASRTVPGPIRWRESDSTPPGRTCESGRGSGPWRGPIAWPATGQRTAGSSPGRLPASSRAAARAHRGDTSRLDRASRGPPLPMATGSGPPPARHSSAWWQTMRLPLALDAPGRQRCSCRHSAHALANGTPEVRLHPRGAPDRVGPAARCGDIRAPAPACPYHDRRSRLERSLSRNGQTGAPRRRNWPGPVFAS